MTDKKHSVVKKLIWLFTAAAVVILDQLSKKAVLSEFHEEGASRVAIKGLLNFTYIRNPGATAGILANNRWVFMAASTVIIIALAVYLAVSKKQSAFGGIAFAMVIGGGIGNMIDRVAYGEVVDFLDVTATDVFPFNCIFNVADAFVVVGCILLVISFIADEAKAKKEEKSDENTPKEPDLPSSEE